jgi:hypothetical protein
MNNDWNIQYYFSRPIFRLQLERRKKSYGDIKIASKSSKNVVKFKRLEIVVK